MAGLASVSQPKWRRAAAPVGPRCGRQVGPALIGATRFCAAYPAIGTDQDICYDKGVGCLSGLSRRAGTSKLRRLLTDHARPKMGGRGPLFVGLIDGMTCDAWIGIGRCDAGSGCQRTTEPAPIPC